jgi:hypothetical protein
VPWRTGSLGAALLTLVVAACGGSTTPPTITPPSPPIEASASLAPADVKAVFLQAITDPGFSGRATISGTIALAGIDGEVSGELTFVGPDSRTRTTVSLPGNEQTNESIIVGSDGWKRTGDGPWLERERPPDPKSSFTATLALLKSLQDLGTESREGVDLHHFQPSGGGRMSAQALGLDNPEMKDPTVSADFYSTAEGVPAAFDFHLRWTQAIGGQDTPVTMEMQMDLDEVGSTPSIDPPSKADVWRRYESAFGYSMAHPPGWTVKHTQTEDRYLLDNQGYVFVAPQALTSGEKLNSFQAELISYYEQQFGTEPESRESTSIGGSPAFRLVYHFRNSSDQDVALVDLATLHAGQGWEISIRTLAGATEAEDIAVFDDFVSTFKFTK